jgi:hypothetical protein
MLWTANSRIDISASLCLIAPKLAIGWPNCLRSAAYFAASPTTERAPPPLIAASLNRP